MKSLKYIGFSLMAAAVFSACSTSKTVVSNGEYDDLYASSESAGVVYSPTVSKKADSYAPDYLENYSDAYDRMPLDSTIDGTDAYYDENYVSSRDFNRSVSPDAGYSSGYADGYAEGWNDYAWNTPYSWNRFGYNNWNTWNNWNSWNALGYSPWGSGNFFFGGYSYLPMASSLAFSYGYNFGGWSSPWGLSRFGYNPWGFNNFAFSPWGYGYSSYGMYGYGYSFANGWSPYYGAQPVFANRSYDTRFAAKRSYGPRAGGRATSIYNDGFVNTRRPSATASSRRTINGTNTATRGELTSRANGTVARSNGPTSYDSYTRRNAGNTMSRTGVERVATTGRTYTPSRAGSTSYGRNTGTSSRTGTFNRTEARSAGSASGSTFSRGSSSNRSSGLYNSGSSNSRTNSGYSRPNTPSRSSGNYSSPSRGSSSSSGSYSRGSSSSSGSRGSSSSSRGPR